MATLKIRKEISMNNKILAWLGKYSFAIYVMQRIPMMILQKYCLPEMNRYVFVLLSLVFTVLLSFLFGLLTDAANKLFFSKTQKNLQ